MQIIAIKQMVTQLPKPSSRAKAAWFRSSQKAVASTTQSWQAEHKAPPHKVGYLGECGHSCMNCQSYTMSTQMQSTSEYSFLRHKRSIIKIIIILERVTEGMCSPISFHENGAV